MYNSMVTLLCVLLTFSIPISNGDDPSFRSPDGYEITFTSERDWNITSSEIPEAGFCLESNFLASLIPIGVFSTILSRITRKAINATLELHLSYDDAFNLCVESLSMIKRHKIEEKEILEGEIVARVGITLWSPGETISFNLGRIDNQKTYVKVVSKPLPFPIFLFDHGKNVDNVEKIIRFLRERTAVEILSSNILSFLLTKY
jgi:hypothetical protein